MTLSAINFGQCNPEAFWEDADLSYFVGVYSVDQNNRKYPVT